MCNTYVLADCTLHASLSTMCKAQLYMRRSDHSNKSSYSDNPAGLHPAAILLPKRDGLCTSVTCHGCRVIVDVRCDGAKHGSRKSIVRDGLTPGRYCPRNGRRPTHKTQAAKAMALIPALRLATSLLSLTLNLSSFRLVPWWTLLPCSPPFLPFLLCSVSVPVSSTWVSQLLRNLTMAQLPNLTLLLSSVSQANVFRDILT
jgi:hypothetical protein